VTVEPEVGLVTLVEGAETEPEIPIVPVAEQELSSAPLKVSVTLAPGASVVVPVGATVGAPHNSPLTEKLGVMVTDWLEVNGLLQTTVTAPLAGA
jgi:hypothetical protein